MLERVRTRTQWVSLSPSPDSSPDSDSTSVDSDSSTVDSDSGLMDSDSGSTQVDSTRTHIASGESGEKYTKYTYEKEKKNVCIIKTTQCVGVCVGVGVRVCVCVCVQFLGYQNVTK